MAKAELSARSVRTAAQARRIVRQRGLDYVKVGVFDMDGVLRGKYMGVEKFMAALDKGFGFCDVILGWDSNDQLYDNTTFTSWHTGYPDAEVRIVPETCPMNLTAGACFSLPPLQARRKPFAPEVCWPGSWRGPRTTAWPSRRHWNTNFSSSMFFFPTPLFLL